MMKTETLQLTEAWDKTFPKSEQVDHRKVTFVNRYGITLAADMYTPKAEGRLPAIAVCGPFGAVKEQCSGLYAQTMAERGFLTLAFDPSFTGESGGQPRYMASPDINTEDFQAAVDFLSVQDNVDPERIGIIGICGWGGLALNTAAIDARVKATAVMTMYDMSRVNANGYFDSMDEDARYAAREALNAQRIAAPVHIAGIVDMRISIQIGVDRNPLGDDRFSGKRCDQRRKLGKTRRQLRRFRNEIIDRRRRDGFPRLQIQQCPDAGGFSDGFALFI